MLHCQGMTSHSECVKKNVGGENSQLKCEVLFSLNLHNNRSWTHLINMMLIKREEAS